MSFSKSVAEIHQEVIDGRRYILIPADDGVEINGIGVHIPNPAKTDCGGAQ